MIEVRHVHKRYQTDHGPGPWVLQGVNLTIPARISVGLLGANGQGKSTLLNIIAGVDHANKGSVRRHSRVSWPMGYGGGLQGSLTGRQNCKFVCRIHGQDQRMDQVIDYVQTFADIGPAFDEPVKTYSSGMKSRLQFGLSLAFDFDVYISDEVTAAGDAAFRQKAAQAFKDKTSYASVIMVSHDTSTLRKFCTAGVWLQNGQAHWFDNIEDAIKAYASSIPQ
jgi:capsular polysaccharide transport system ATP-binding protein